MPDPSTGDRSPNSQDAINLSEASLPIRYHAPFNPDAHELFRLSRSKIDLFMKCQRCFYLDRRCETSPAGSPPYTLNNRVDELLKREFDHYRARQEPHPYMLEYGIDAVPFQHPQLDSWREPLFHGITYRLPKTSLLISGGIDDVWCRRDGTLHIVDYKATSKEGEVDLDQDWQIGYKRQVELYQWLFRMNGFTVSDTAYFVYCNGNTSQESFNNNLSFSVKIIGYQGTNSWIEKALYDVYDTLRSPNLPASGEGCKDCRYRAKAAVFESV